MNKSKTSDVLKMKTLWFFARTLITQNNFCQVEIIPSNRFCDLIKSDPVFPRLGYLRMDS